jgi:hypothetical protein
MDIMLKNVRIAFCQSALGAAEDYQGNGNFRHSATFIIEPGSANDKAIRDAIKAEAVTVFAKKADATLKSLEGNSNKYCYQPGDLKEYDGFQGNMYIGAHRGKKDGPPLLLDNDKQVLKGDEGRIYAGCYVNAKVSIYCQDGKNSGVRCGLKGIQFAKDGDAFSGAVRAKDDDFDDVSAESEDDLA